MKPKEKDFDEVQKALAFKRHEQPPRKYFRSLSEEVLNRLQEPDSAPPRSLPERLGFGESWKPIILCLLGALVCVVVAVGWIASLSVDQPDESIAESQTDPAAKVYAPEQAPAADAAPQGFQPLPGGEEGGNVGPVMTPDGSGPLLGQPEPVAEPPR